MKFTDKQIDNLFKSIYEGLITVDNLPEDLYFAIAGYIKRGLYEGFGGTLADFEFGGTDYELLNELRTNTYLFSGAKTYQQVREFSSFVADSKTFKDFYEQAQKTYEQYNVDWAKAEYNTAIGQAQSAKAWAGFEENKELFPLLRYSAVMDANTSDICRPLDGITRPVDDPFWNVHAPLNHFNCFTGETKIVTEKGLVNIQNVNIGDSVQTHNQQYKKVLHIHINKFDGLLKNIKFSNSEIVVNCTPNHKFLKFLCLGDEWIEANELKEFDFIKCGLNSYTKIVSIKEKEYNGLVYNLMVDEDESYTLSNGVKVHNCRCLLEKIDKYEGAKQSSDARIKQVAKEMDAKMDDTFKMNPGKDGYIFSPEHPYFEVAKGDKALARNNFNLPIPKND